jgi:hypothetical protein
MENYNVGSSGGVWLGSCRVSDEYVVEMLNRKLEQLDILDMFAMSAMNSFIMNDPEDRNGYDKIAEWSYTQAEQMLKARAKHRTTIV